MIGALAEKIDRNDGPRLEAGADRGRNPALQRSCVHVERRFIDIDEYRCRAGQCHRLPGRTERKGRAEHRIARADAFRHQHHQQRVGAAGAAHDMPGAAEIRESGLELGHFRAVDELAMSKHPSDGLVDGFAEPAALGADIDEGHGFERHMLVHGALRKFKKPV